MMWTNLINEHNLTGNTFYTIHIIFFVAAHLLLSSGFGDNHVLRKSEFWDVGDDPK